MSTMTSELPLSELVRRAWDDGKVPYRQMEARARRAGHTISHSQLQAYATDGVRKAPNDAQMHAIAAAIDVGYETVRTAMFQQYYGYTATEVVKRQASRVAAAIPGNLSLDEERELMRMIRAWDAARRGD